MSKRKMIRIDESKCDGCGLCASACAEGAIEIVDGKARLISETYCDGLGACIGECPRGALTIEEREAKEFDEAATKEHLKRVKAPDLPCGCPGTMVRQFEPRTNSAPELRASSRLRQWPVQLHLIPPHAPYLKSADLVLLADCTAFAYANMHQDFIKDRAIAIACPKLDDTGPYLEKLVQIIKMNGLRSIEAVMMEVPCCGGLGALAEQAVAISKAGIPVKNTIIELDGNIRCKI